MIQGCDFSEWQNVNTPVQGDFVIIRTSHGLVEDLNWRLHYNVARAEGKKVGFYHYAEHNDPVAEAKFFNNLCGPQTGLKPEYGWWCDAESEQDETWVKTFRAIMPSGVYGSAHDFIDSMHNAFNHDPFIWLAWPDTNTATNDDQRTLIANALITQYGQNNGVDVDRTNWNGNYYAPPPPPPNVFVRAWRWFSLKGPWNR